ncbi:hypothetical protein D3C78_1708800 [compost metagenome]
MVWLLDQLLFKALLPSAHHLLLGALLVAMVLFSSDGLLPMLRQRGRQWGERRNA